MQSQETQDFGSHSCLPTGKRSRHRKKNQYWVQNSDLYKFDFNSLQPSDGCHSALQKIKIVQRMCVLHAVKVMIFISDVQNYVPIKLCKTAGSIHLFKITGTLKPENLKLNRNSVWDTLELDWKKVNMTF